MELAMTPTASAAQLAANRANAQRSTGPRSHEGKGTSSLNAFRHGLTGQIALLAADDLNHYEAYTKRLIDFFQPVGPDEEDLARTIADERWRLHHLRILQNNMFACAVFEETPGLNITVEAAPGPQPSDADAVAQPLSPSNSSSDPEALTPDLGQAQVPEQAVLAAISQVRHFQEHHRAFLNLSLYAQRTARLIEKSTAKLEQIQAGRKSATSLPAQGLVPPGSQPQVQTEAPTPDPHSLTAGRGEAPIGFVFSSPQPDRLSCFQSAGLTSVMAQKFPLVPLEIVNLSSETRKNLDMDHAKLSKHA